MSNNYVYAHASSGEHVAGTEIVVYKDHVVGVNTEWDVPCYYKLKNKIKKIKSKTINYKAYVYILLDNNDLVKCGKGRNSYYASTKPELTKVIEHNVSDFNITDKNVFIKLINGEYRKRPIDMENSMNNISPCSIFNNVIYYTNGDIAINNGEKVVYNIDNVKFAEYLAGDDKILIIKNDSSLLIYDIKSKTKTDTGIKAIYVTTNYNSALIIDENKSLYAYGSNSDGELGTDKKDIKTPVKINYINNIRECGLFTMNDNKNQRVYGAYAITEENILYFSGRDYFDAFPKVGGETIGKFTKMYENVSTICGHYYNKLCYIDINGNAPIDVNMSYSNAYVVSHENLELLTRNISESPIQTSKSHTIYLKDDNIMTCGKNNCGQLGLNDTRDRNVLTKVSGINNVKQISIGDEHSMILYNDGTIATCGSNRFGQLGLGNNTDKHVFTKVPGIKDVEQISCGGNTSMIKLSNGTIMVCGDNTVGQLCLGDNKNRNTFTKVSI